MSGTSGLLLTLALCALWFAFGLGIGRDLERERQRRRHAARNVCFPLPTGPPFPLPRQREPYP